MIEGKIVKTILADDEICNQLAKYNNTPAVFSQDVLPKDCALPAVLVTPVAPGNFGGTRDSKGGEMYYDVTVWFDRANIDDDEKQHRALSRKLWRFLDRVEILDLDDIELEDCGVYADMPVKHEDHEGFPGYTIRVRAILLDTSNE